MGSGTKKHKKDRDSRKHRYRSRSRSPQHSPDVEIIHDSRDSADRESSRNKHRHRHHHFSSGGGNTKYRSRSKSRSSDVIIKSSSYDSSNNIKLKDREKDYDRERRHAHHKRHKERKHKHRARTPERERQASDYHSDSSDVIEVPLAPPAPIISNISKGEYRAKSPSPIPENGAGDVLSIEETNKLRAKLGLKPLEVDSSGPISGTTKESNSNKNEDGLNSYKDEWGEFLHKPADNLSDKIEAEKIREKLKQHKERRLLENKLKKVKALGESDEEVDDLKIWVEKNKKKDELRKEAERRAKMLEEMDQEFGVGNLVEQETKKTKDKAYRDRDLKGLRVEHNIEEFAEGREVILTLKDKGVLEDDDDALVNVNMIDEERYKKNVENKKQRPDMYGYNVYEEGYDELGNPIERGILGKYDDEIGAQKKKSFVIGQNMEEERKHQRKLLEIKTKLAGKKLETLEDAAIKLASDTYTETELETFKKPKKKIKKLRQKLKAEDLLNLTGDEITSKRDLGSRRNKGSATSTGTTATNSIPSATVTSINSLHTDDTPQIKEDLSKLKVETDDDDELQRILSKARKLKQKENIIRKPLPVEPSELKNEIKTEADSDDEMNGGTKDGHIILNATAEFCRTLGDIPTYGMAGNRDEDSNEMMDYENEPEPEIIKQEPISSTGTWNSVNPDLVSRVLSGDENSNDVSDVAILDEEPDVGSGVAAALRLAMSKGYLEKDDKNRPSNSRMAHLQAKNYSIEDKAYGEEDKFGRRDRYHTGPIMEFKEKDTFKPNVKLEYIDDNGRVLNAKEAFRYLSHKFHGKGPGKNKIEKRLKKSEQEGLMKKMSSTDTPLGTLSMLQQKQKETHAPYVVLSGGKQTQVGTSIAKHK